MVRDELGDRTHFSISNSVLGRNLTGVQRTRILSITDIKSLFPPTYSRGGSISRKEE